MTRPVVAPYGPVRRDHHPHPVSDRAPPTPKEASEDRLMGTLNYSTTIPASAAQIEAPA